MLKIRELIFLNAFEVMVRFVCLRSLSVSYFYRKRVCILYFFLFQNNKKKFCFNMRRDNLKFSKVSGISNTFDSPNILKWKKK